MSLDILHLHQADWRAEFGSGDFTRGVGYAEQRRSTLLSLKDHILTASCQGSAAQVYRQRITLQPYGQGWGVSGRCNCPVGFNCKHVVAALLTLEAQQHSGADLSALIVPSKDAVEQRVEGLQPQPLLTLGSHVRVHFDARKGRMHEQTQHRAALAFDYQGQRTFGKPAKDLLVRQSPALSLRIIRDGASEAALRKRLEDTGLQVALRQSEALPEHAGEPFELSHDSAWLKFVQEQLPRLRDEGWQIHMQADFQFNLAQVDDWYAEVEEAPELDWFELELGIEVEGQRISLLPILLQAIRRTPWLLNGEALNKRADDEVMLVNLPQSTRRIALPFARLKPLLATLGELFLREPGESSQRLRLPRADAARLSELEQGPALSWQGGAPLREFAQRLHTLPAQSIQAPEGLRAELRPYQLHGVAWMQALGELQVGGVLADDMGLGKTLQTLAHILGEKHAGRLQHPALIVMPTSLIPNWQDEAARFAPQLKVLALYGPKRRSQFKLIGEHDIILSTYALLPRDLKALTAQPFQLLILDEAQNIKNPRSKAALAAGQIQARQRLCLTGTPLENHLGELWALFNFLMPGWLGDSKGFTRDYRTPIEKQGNEQRLAHLRGRIKPFILRRNKEQVAPELPPKTEITHWVELSADQRDRYETLRLAMDQKVRAEIARQGLARSQIVILEALLRLRQACCDLRLLDDGNDPNPATLSSHDSGKLSALLEMLEELFAEGRRVLLFSQFTSMLALIEVELQKRQIDYAKLTGSTQDRRTPVAQFQSGELPIFLISLKAGGAGLNLTAADTVIHFDPWWNPAAEAQASDRAYRIGQDKPVFVYKLIARGSVEEKIQQLQQAKANLARGVLEGASQGQWQLNEDDLQDLFAPLPH
ncbi:non-specific serine/threonine protein kinase [Pseudomonas sp. SJZ079]|uniref:DEAD/DEAH box helicase n=1 Tax=Pseudomonas sp. SJZ079 TaxID=2572887 RepID=UPI00119A376A|nr:DEAD/DEAH box helicase [Pseudomonas sp. SJZ079]TWC28394.1 non-specific serine/threonine protein kinase [Pseudomonas sp. SJZ079]